MPFTFSDILGGLAVLAMWAVIAGLLLPLFG